MDRLLRYFLGQFIRRGAMTFTTASGAQFRCGDGTGKPVSVRFLTKEAERRVLLNPELGLGEVYMDGTFVVEQGSIADALAILLDQPEILPQWAKPQWVLRYLVRRARQFNPRGRARNNVAHHYDLDGRLYSLFLDADRQYSCAYFETPDSSLDDAQLAKKRHLAAKLLISPEDRVLDIGSGWGGLGLYLAEMTGANVTGVTLSTEQLQVSNARAAEKNLTESAKFLLEDYRDIPGPFDRSCRSACSSMSGVALLRNLFQALRRTSHRRRRHGAAFDRPFRRPRRHQSLDREIHFPRRLHPGAVGGDAGDRARRTSGVRHRNPAPALRGNPEGLARAFHGAAGGSRATL